jgi:hypothetical protein
MPWLVPGPERRLTFVVDLRVEPTATVPVMPSVVEPRSSLAPMSSSESSPVVQAGSALIAKTTAVAAAYGHATPA